ncbi:hypothetical protein AAC387_Pa09g1020 [Persea americana]
MNPIQDQEKSFDLAGCKENREREKVSFVHRSKEEAMFLSDLEGHCHCLFGFDLTVAERGPRVSDLVSW